MEGCFSMFLGFVAMYNYSGVTMGFVVLSSGEFATLTMLAEDTSGASSVLLNWHSATLEIRLYFLSEDSERWPVRCWINCSFVFLSNNCVVQVTFTECPV